MTHEDGRMVVRDAVFDTIRSGPSIPLAPLTTLGLGGIADTIIAMDDAAHVEDLAGVVADVGAEPVPVGGGSNIVAADEGVRTPVVLVRTSGVTYRPAAEPDRVLVTVQAGHSWGDLLEELTGEGLVGMETMAGIPGTVGAMPVQNVGAYGQETADTVVEVTAWDWQEGRQVTFDAAGCRFGHRTSRFKHTHRWLILTVTFSLARGVLAAPVTYRQVAAALGVQVGTRVPVRELMSAVRHVRAGKGMLLEAAGVDARTVGSVFLSPRVGPKTAAELAGRGASINAFPDGSNRVSASWLIRRAGYQLGQGLGPGIRMSTRHYTLVAQDGATAASFVEATRQVQDHVLQATGVLLTPEPDPIGELPEYRLLIDRTTPQDH